MFKHFVLNPFLPLEARSKSQDVPPETLAFGSCVTSNHDNGHTCLPLVEYGPRTHVMSSKHYVLDTKICGRENLGHKEFLRKYSVAEKVGFPDNEEKCVSSVKDGEEHDVQVMHMIRRPAGDVTRSIGSPAWISEWHRNGARVLDGVERTVYCISFVHNSSNLSPTATEYHPPNTPPEIPGGTPARTDSEKIEEEEVKRDVD
ncbi:hypothetical protein QBC34DRAFT_403325 [Podospora aff. communis PSN243]|uniref:Uncharacterized protein n=1 Tax=Podospora aff. communis PSN243 TaxID=3040156 RepID=A0AAV9GRU5_9PEZI|nr:hypothetical protein QBC34DRAFT_403325 [Podospora aff. communis PSN243]